MNPTLRKGQLLRPLHPALAEREWGLEGDAVGRLICCYRVGVGPSSLMERVDVRFNSGRTVWGAPAREFAPTEEAVGPAERH